MALYLRGEIWWIRIAVRNIGTVRESTGYRKTEKRAAKEWHDQRLTELRAEAAVRRNPALARHRWDEAVLKWLDENGHKRDIEGDRQRLRLLHPDLRGSELRDITHDRLTAILAKHSRLKTPAARNRYRATVRAILRKAEREWEWIDRAPVIRLEREPPTPGRWITREEAGRLVAASPAHLQPVIRFALATGLRKSNILDLRWDHVDLQNRQLWVSAEDAKGKKTIGLPLNGPALDVLIECRGKHPEYVFTVDGRPYQWVDHRTWLGACRRAGLEGFRFHDLRHTAISWLAQAGVDPQRLRQIGGWSTMAMVERYSHLNVENLRAAMELLPDVTPAGGGASVVKIDRSQTEKSTISAQSRFGGVNPSE